MAEAGLTKGQLIQELTKSPHAAGVVKRKKGEKLPKLSPQQKQAAEVAKLSEAYLKVGRQAGEQDPDFFAHLCVWNAIKGSVRDAKVALPIIALQTVPAVGDEYMDNALALTASLRPRELVRALEFGRAIGAGSRVLDRLTERYLRDLEADRGGWERVAIQHRQTLKTLYGRYHIKPVEWADAILFKQDYPMGSRFAALKELPNFAPEDMAGLIGRWKFPFLAVRGVLGGKLKDPDVLVAVMGRMSGPELVTNMKALERLGVKEVPAARAKLEEMLGKAVTKGGSALKAGVAAEAQEDEVLAGKLRGLQERQLDASKGIEGNWLVLGDKSGSMSTAIEKAKEVSAVLARMVKGAVSLIFFDNSPVAYDASGKTLEQIQTMTRGVTAGGGTSIGCGVRMAMDAGFMPDGIVLVSDGGENGPPGGFVHHYQALKQKFGNEPTVYWYRVKGDGGMQAGVAIEARAFRAGCERAHIDVQEFDVNGVDYYSLPNLVQTMRVGRYSLMDEVMAQDLLTVDQILKRTVGWKRETKAKGVSQ